MKDVDDEPDDDIYRSQIWEFPITGASVSIELGFLCSLYHVGTIGPVIPISTLLHSQENWGWS